MIKSSDKTVCFQPVFKTVDDRCSSEFVWQGLPRCWSSVLKSSFAELKCVCCMLLCVDTQLGEATAADL